MQPELCHLPGILDTWAINIALAGNHSAGGKGVFILTIWIYMFAGAVKYFLGSYCTVHFRRLT